MNTIYEDEFDELDVWNNAFVAVETLFDGDDINENLKKVLMLVRDFICAKDAFIYKDSTKEILNDFNEWSEELPILILDNLYTENYLKELTNEKESILKYLNEEYSDDIINRLINKYNLE